MNTIIKFDRVSKRYQLGMTRTSLPTAMRNWSRSIFRRGEQRDSEDQSIWALRDINFTLDRGKSLALIGPNGAGKTTILKLLANITKPSFGKILAEGRISALIELGAGFHPDLSGRENIYLNGTILGLSKREIRDRFDEIVAFSELERFIDTPIKRYSSGMIVRLGFAVAAWIDPEILLVDEVLAVGDASFRQKCLNRINELVTSGVSVIFVSHTLWLSQAVSDTALYIDSGEIKFQGNTADVIEKYDRAINEQRARNFEKEQPTHTSQHLDIEITKIEVASLLDGNTTDLKNDQPAEIRMYYYANRPFESINAVVRIVRSDGVTCISVRTSFDEYSMALGTGAGVLTVTLDPLQLYGGTYMVQGVFRDDRETQSLSAGWSDWFYVIGSNLSSQEMNGVFEPNRKWDHVQGSATIGDSDGASYSRLASGR